MTAIGGGQPKADFEATVLPHLSAAHNLARWLMRDEQDAQEVVQDAVLRALRFFDGFRGTDGRGWLLTIVRNACYTRLRKLRPGELQVSFDEESHAREDGGRSPELELVRSADARSLREAVERLPVELREAIVLRELEGLSYAEIAAVADVPIGTVMSRLSRSRRRLRESLRPPREEEV